MSRKRDVAAGRNLFNNTTGRNRHECYKSLCCLLECYRKYGKDRESNGRSGGESDQMSAGRA